MRELVAKARNIQVEGFQKMQKAYDSLMKSGRFTAAQNKDDEGEFVNCIGELVAICEAEGFIPRYYTEGPMDKVDQTLVDLQRYTHDLVVKEMNLGNMIENAIRDIQLDKERESIIDVADGDADEDIMNYTVTMPEIEEEDEVVEVDEDGLS